MQKSQPNLSIQPLIHNNIVQASASVWPNDYKFRDELSIPLSLIVHPLELEHYQDGTEHKRDNKQGKMQQNEKENGLSQIQASFSGTTNISQYRCHSCKAFINSYCTIISKSEYNCSICGCTNRLSQKEESLNSLSVELTSPVYLCRTDNPAYRRIHPSSNNNNNNNNINGSANLRTFAFAIDTTYYGEHTRIAVHYIVDVIKEYIQLLQAQNRQNEQHKMSSNIQIMIFGFDDRIIQYHLTTSQSAIDAKNSKQNEQAQVQVQLQKLIDTSYGQYLQTQISQFYLSPIKHISHLQQILSDLLQIVDQQDLSHLHQYSSQALLNVIQKILRYTPGCVGRLYVITGISQYLDFWDTMLQQPEQFRSNYTLNSTKCIPATLSHLVQKTQLSICIYLYTRTPINLMPLYALTKSTNGQLRHYLTLSDTNQSYNLHQLYYQFRHSLCVESLALGTHTVVKVRHSVGLKLVAAFGQYHQAKEARNDQIQLGTCPNSRAYMFQFLIQGKIMHPYLNIQFSILWTDRFGRTTFKVITHSQKVSNNKLQILSSINYGVVNQAYLWAVIYNMDLNSKLRSLQLTLQQRCRKHIKALQLNQPQRAQKIEEVQLIKKATPYIMFTFYLMRHFIMNTKFIHEMIYDKSIQLRSRILTGDVTAIHSIWPVVYAVNRGKQSNQIVEKQGQGATNANEGKRGTKSKKNRDTTLVEMRYEQIKDAQVAIVIDQGDFCYVHVMNSRLRKQLNDQKRSQPNKLVIDIIDSKPQLKQLSKILKQIRQEKASGFMEISTLQNLQGICILDEKGPLSYSNFLTNLVS